MPKQLDTLRLRENFREEFDGASWEEIQARVGKSVLDRFGTTYSNESGGTYQAGAWVMATYEDRVAFAREGKCWEAPYSIDESGNVILGDAYEVIPTFSKITEVIEPQFIREVEGTKGREWDVILIRAGLSLNGRYYPGPVLKESVKLFDGVDAYANHPTKTEEAEIPERRAQDKVGRFVEAKYGKFDVNGKKVEGIRARFKVITPWLREVLVEANEAGERDFLGLSINAEGTGGPRDHDGRTVLWVESITKVHSVDVVTQPAAGGEFIKLVASNREGGGMSVSKEELQAMLDKASEQAAAAASQTMKDILAERDAQAAAAAEEARKAAATANDAAAAAAGEDPQKQGGGGTATATKEGDDPASAGAPTPELVAAQEALKEARAITERMRVQENRGRLELLLKEANISETGKGLLRARWTEAIDRRDVSDDDIKATIKETQEYEAAIRQPGSDPRGLGGAHVGDSEREKIVKALEGWFESKDVDGVERLPSLQTGYLKWEGLDSFALQESGGHIEMMYAFGTTGMPDRHGRLHGYDSEIHHKKLQESILTTTWGNLFADTLFKQMTKEFTAQPYATAWRTLVSDIDRASDFRVRSWNRVGGYGNLAAVGEGFPYPLLTSPGDERVQYQVAKYGGIDDVTWEATLTDDLNRIRTMPREMAIAAARTLYQFVMNLATTTNPNMDYDAVALYHATHNNTGTDALSLAGMNNTQIAMRSQTRFGATDPLGMLNAIGTIIVPNELEQRAQRIVNPSASYNFAINNTSGTAAQIPDVDTAIDPQAFANKGINVLVNDFLTDANDWWAVADARRVSTMVIGFLNGREEPEIFVQDGQTVGAVFTADKISYKIRFVFGGDVLEHRSFYRQVVT